MAAVPSSTPLLPLLRELHLLPSLPASLQTLTFPELSCYPPHQRRPKRHLISAQLLDLIRVSPQLRDAYISDPGVGRLFALLDGEILSLFSIRKGEGLISMGRCSAASIGDRSAFLSCDRSLLDRLFPSPLWAEMTALTSSESLLIAENSPIGALHSWILPQKEGQGALFDSLFSRFSSLVASSGLLHLLAEGTAPETIRLAIQGGADPNEIDRRRRTPLHRAAEVEKIENALALIASGAEKDLKDLDGRTPLHLALLQDNLPLVESLLEAGCDPSLLTSEGENLLHLAVSQGNTDLVGFLLNHPKSQEWLHQGDSDGKIPLHRAVWGDPKPAIVDLLLRAGTRVDTANLYGYTALHWAAKHGHFESARRLLNAGAEIGYYNKNGDTPFNLALNWGQDEIVWLFVSGEESFSSQATSSSSSSSDPEGATYLAFETAYEAGRREAQIFWLQKLAQISIEKRDYTSTAHLLNGALVLSQDGSVNPACRAHLLNQLERIEGLFLEDVFQKKTPASHRNYLKGQREELQRIRAETADLVKEGWATEDVQQRLTKSYQTLLNILLDECIALIGKGYPDGFAVMGLGSMARLEMCPYSDLEFAFLIEDSSPERLNYFRKLSQFLTLKMINMGETKCELLRFKRGKAGEEDRPAKSFVSSGFSMDIGGLCPSGKSGIYELIGTPAELARFQTEEWLRDNDSEVILVNAMTTVSCVTGESSLVAAYQKEIGKILDQKVDLFSLGSKRRRLRQNRALELIKGFVTEFQPKLDQDKIDLRGFDVKKELYRLPQTVISGLALYHGLTGQNTLQSIDELRKKRLIGTTGAKQLNQAFRSILRLRIEAHLFYKTEYEILYNDRGEDDSRSDELLIISPEIRLALVKIYRILIPLYRQTHAFLNGDKKAFEAYRFYKDQSINAHDDFETELLRDKSLPNKDVLLAERAAALNPSGSAHLGLGLIQLGIGQARQAVKNIEKALRLFKMEYGDLVNCNVVDSLTNLGKAYQYLGDYHRAIDYFEQSLLMLKRLYGHDLDIAIILMDLGKAYYCLGDNHRAINYFEDSIEVYRPEYPGRPFLNEKTGLIYAKTLTNLGNVYAALSSYNSAIDYQEKSLEITKKIHDDRPHLDIVEALSNLGSTYYSLSDYKEAIWYYEQSLAIYKQICSKPTDPIIARSLKNLGSAYRGLRILSKAVEYCEQSITMCQQIYDDHPHPDTAESLDALGNVYRSSGNLPKAIESLQSSYEMFVATVGIDHPKTKKAKTSLEAAIAASQPSTATSSC